MDPEPLNRNPLIEARTLSLPRPLVAEVLIYLEGIRAYEQNIVSKFYAAARDHRKILRQREANWPPPGDKFDLTDEEVQRVFSGKYVPDLRNFLHQASFGLRRIAAQVSEAIDRPEQIPLVAEVRSGVITKKDGVEYTSLKIIGPELADVGEDSGREARLTAARQLLDRPADLPITANMILYGETPATRFRNGLEHAIARLSIVVDNNPIEKIGPHTVYDTIHALIPLRTVQRMCESLLNSSERDRLVHEVPHPEPSDLFPLNLTQTRGALSHTMKEQLLHKISHERPMAIPTLLGSDAINEICNCATVLRSRCHAKLIRERRRLMQINEASEASRQAFPEGVTEREALRTSQSAVIDLMEKAAEAHTANGTREMNRAKRWLTDGLEHFNGLLSGHTDLARESRQRDRDAQFDDTAIKGMANLYVRLKKIAPESLDFLTLVRDQLGGLVFAYRDLQRRIEMAGSDEPVRTHARSTARDVVPTIHSTGRGPDQGRSSQSVPARSVSDR